jgi:CubicO group peptidase (beta-lactamase class C family)
MRRRNMEYAKKRIHLIILILLVLFLSLFFLPVPRIEAQSSPFDLRNDPEVEKIIEEFRSRIPEILKKEKNLPGLSIALVDRKGAVWTEGFGYTDKTRSRRVDTSTIFSIQSMSKTFTATGMMMAAQEGLLDLDVPIKTYLHDFRIQTRFDERPLEKITLKHLLSHKAGFTHEAPVGNNYDTDSPSLEAHAKSISDTWLRYPIGTRYSYSNLGIDLAGYILQVTAKKPFEIYMQENLFGPLGMKNSSFDVEVVRKNKNRATGYDRFFEKVPLAIPMIPAGSVYSSAEDMAKFIQFHLNKGMIDNKSLLNPALIDEMYTIPYPLEGQKAGYALGISKSFFYLNERKLVFLDHGGGGFGFLSVMRWVPELGLGIVILTNSVNHNSVHGNLANQIIDKLIALKSTGKQASPSLKSRKDEAPVEMSPDALKNLAGFYQGRGLVFQLKIKDDKLGIELMKKFYPLIFYSDNEASTENYDYKFILNEDGRPSYLIRFYDSSNWDYNEGPDDKPGANKPEWKKYLGTYRFKQYGKLRGTHRVHVKNGYMYFDRLRLVEEHQPGLFFSSTGEALDFRGKIPTWRNIKLEKSSR